LRPGDVVGTNDPWLCTGHLFDLMLMSPVHVDGQLVGLAAVVAHLPDIGGRGFAVDSATVFEEGLRIPPLLLADAEGLKPDLKAILTANVRVPEQVLGDIGAMLNSLAVISGRLVALCGDIGTQAFHAVCADLEDRTERYMRQAIAGLPNGTYTSRVASDGVLGKGFSVELSATGSGDEVATDLTSASPDIGAAGSSCQAYTRAYVISALKCLLAPRLPFNEGILRPIRLEPPAGSVVDSRFPAAGAARNLVGHYI